MVHGTMIRWSAYVANLAGFQLSLNKSIWSEPQVQNGSRPKIIRDKENISCCQTAASKWQFKDLCSQVATRSIKAESRNHKGRL